MSFEQSKALRRRLDRDSRELTRLRQQTTESRKQPTDKEQEQARDKQIDAILIAAWRIKDLLRKQTDWRSLAVVDEVAKIEEAAMVKPVTK